MEYRELERIDNLKKIVFDKASATNPKNLFKKIYLFHKVKNGELIHANIETTAEDK